MKVECDNRSKFSNLSNWKEEAWKNQGFNGIQTHDLRDTGAMLYQLSYISYISHDFTAREDMNSINWPCTQCVAS